MQATARPTARPTPCGAAHGGARAPHAAPRGASRRAPAPCAALAGGEEGPAASLRDRAAVLLTGFAAGALALNPAAAFAADAPSATANKAPAKPEAPTVTRTPAQLQAELEKRNKDDLDSLTKDLEAAKVAAVKSVGELQKRVAAEHAAMVQLQAELRTAKAQLGDSQKEVEKEKALLVAAKDAALAAKKEAAEAATAAHAAELALRGQAGLKSLQSPLGIAAASGWGVAALVALAKRRGPADEIDWSKVEGKDEILKAMETARFDSEQLRRESDDLKRELTNMQRTVGQLTQQLEQERSQRDTLRETIMLLEHEVSSMESRMNTAKSEATNLKKKLDDVKIPSPKRPTLNEILTGQAATKSSSSSSTSSSGKFASAYGSSSSSKPTGRFGSSLGTSGRAVRVRFMLDKELPFGQSMKLVGSHPALGAWDEARGLTMTWGDGHRWSSECPLPIGTAVEFKAVIAVEGGASQWEDGSNHVLLIPDSTTSSTLNVRVEWGAGTAVLDEAAMKKEKMGGKVLATAGALSSSNSSSSSAAKKSASKKWSGLLG